MNGSAPCSAAEDAPPLLRLEGVSFSYGPREVLHAISLGLQGGAFTSLLGPSGSGKTTLLQILAGHWKPSRGKVLVDGADATHQPPEARGLGLVHQHLALFPHLTVERNVSFGLEVRGVPLARALEKARATLELVALPADTWRRPPDRLSGGQRQRVAIARALAFGPRALLLDEPFTALDRGLRQRLGAELRRIQRETGVTTLLVTHDQQEALALSDTLVVLREGRLVQAGPPAELY
ncbi:MAG: ABC transporter ATP-binding protein, partial [Gemmataceae bacterium]